MNLPFNYVHDCLHSYGNILFPVPSFDRYNKMRWVGIFKWKLKITDKFGFHNCTMTGIK